MKAGDKVYCKLDYHGILSNLSRDKLISGKYYYITEYDPFVNVVKINDIYFEVIYIGNKNKFDYFYDYFYTEKEIRKLKLYKIEKRDND